MRECGECVVCCVYPRITDPELKKEPMTHCVNVLTREPEVPGKSVSYERASGTWSGCKIYDARPKTCRSYICAWKEGYGDEDDRPDKSLMLFDASRGIENALEAKPLAPGKEATPEGRAVAERMSRSAGVPVIMVNFYERRIRRVVGRGI